MAWGRFTMNRGLIMHTSLKYQSTVFSRNLFTSTSRSQKLNFTKSAFTYSAIGLGAGALLGTGYSYWKQREVEVSHQYKEKLFPVLDRLPPVSVSRKVVVPTDNSGLQVTLFQYPTCPFCCKVRAFLDFYGISYDVVEVNPVLRQQMKWTQYKKVPVVLVKVNEGYQQMNDSSMIISALMSFLHDKEQNLRDIVKCYPSVEYEEQDGKMKSEILNRYFMMFHGQTPKKQTKEVLQREKKWRLWADEKLVHVLSPNVYRTLPEALQAFNWFSEVGEWEKLFPFWERVLVIYVGAFAMWIIGKRLKKRHNLKNDVRESLYDNCRAWLKALKAQNTMFMGGDVPDLSDLAVYGVLSSIEGCIAFQDLLENTNISTWFHAMKHHVQNHSGQALLS